MRPRSCKVYYSILTLCYLEVLLWITCVISSGAHTPLSADSLYIERETANLKEAYSTPSYIEEDTFLGAWIAHVARQLVKELQKFKEAVILPANSRPHPNFCLAFIPIPKGVPAPFTGVKALS
eukprot:jgi/Botrbrau1/18681/Bobra.0386s0009.1